MDAPIESTAQVLEMYDQLTNWGRWGNDDELGTLNLISEEKRLEAAALVRSGRIVSCARLIQLGSERNPQSSIVTYKDQRLAMEYFGFVYHGPAMTHLDGLGHIFHEGRAYNGVSVDEVGLQGVTRSDAAKLRNGIVSRGILLDIPRLRGVDELAPGEAIHIDELLGAEADAGVVVGPGDVLFVRTGFSRAWTQGRTPNQPDRFPGCHADVLPWLFEKGVALLGSDAISDVVPSGFEEPVSQPIHWVGMVAIGLHLIDNADFEDLAMACAEEGRWEFKVAIAPLPVIGGTGSPVNPLALF